jgi:hypothetical protein
MRYRGQLSGLFWSSVAVAALTLAATPAAAAQTRQKFDISGGDLANALNRFATQANREITFSNAVVENATPRGHGSLTGGVDTILLVSDQEGRKGYKQVEVTKQKEGETGELIGVHLLVVELGTDDDGDTVTSCVVQEADAAGLKPVGKGGAKKSPYSDNQQLALKALKTAIREHGSAAPDGIPADMLALGAVHDVVTTGQWLAAYLAAGGGDDKTADSAKSGFFRLVRALQRKDAIGRHSGVVWVPDLLPG